MAFKFVKWAFGVSTPPEPVVVVAGTGGIAKDALAKNGASSDENKLVAATAGQLADAAHLYLSVAAAAATANGRAYPLNAGMILESTYSTGTPALLDFVEIASATQVKKWAGTNGVLGRVIKIFNPSTGLDSSTPAATDTVQVLVMDHFKAST